MGNRGQKGRNGREQVPTGRATRERTRQPAAAAVPTKKQQFKGVLPFPVGGVASVCNAGIPPTQLRGQGESLVHDSQAGSHMSPTAESRALFRIERYSGGGGWC